MRDIIAHIGMQKTHLPPFFSAGEIGAFSAAVVRRDPEAFT
jgi:hypothetical protein